MKKVKIVVGIRRVYRYIDQEKLESECSKIKNKDFIDHKKYRKLEQK